MYIECTFPHMGSKVEQFGKRGYPGALAKLRIKIDAQRKVTLGCMREMGAMKKRIDTLEARVVDLLPLLHDSKKSRKPRS